MQTSGQPIRQRIRHAGVSALNCLIAVAFTQVACGRHPLEQLLEERAGHLDDDDRARIVRALLSAERSFGVDALLLAAVMEQESHFRVEARSNRGAVGLLQIKPATAREIAEGIDGDWPADPDLRDPVLNVHLGAAYLASLHGTFASWDLALTAYNRGPTAAHRARRLGRAPSSRYASRVLNRYEDFKRWYHAQGPGR
jgi:soluble lytic murein transglycosylase